MKILFAAGLAACAALALGGCSSLGKLEPPSVTIKALGDAGCKGTVDVTIGGATGQLGGGFHAENAFHGSCDPANAKPLVVPLAQIGTLAPASATPAAAPPPT